MSVNDILVSVLLPTYNVEDYIDECVESLVNQTHVKLEIIIIDDASSDGTYAKLVEWQRKDSRIKLYKNTENKKIVKTLNFGLKLVSGEYVLRMDGDDVCSLNRVSVLLDFICSNSEYSLVGSSYKGITEDGIFISSTKMPADFNVIKKVLLHSSPVLHIWLAKTSLYLEMNGYRADTVEDYDFLLRAYAEGHKFVNVNDELYSVRLRRGNTRDLQGLKQAKATKYIRNLFLERVKLGSDSFTEKAYFDFVQSSSLMIYLHNKSQFFVYKGVVSKMYLSRCVNFFLAALISPYTFGYFYHRFMYKLLCKIN
jgi:glycosyltransferase involved in cell wall biosynthesis